MSAPNWLGLLRWTIAHTDGTSDSPFAAMSEEDKAWLEKVMKEVVRDDPARMNEIMLSLKALVESIATEGGAVVSEQRAEQAENELDELRDIVEQVDMAHVFAKFRGAEVLLQVACCAALPAAVQSLAAAVVATIAQNNLVTQDLLLQQDVLPRLVALYARTGAVLVAQKTLLAISALCRGHAAAEELFVRDFASLVFPRALESEANGLVSRALFFAHALVVSDYATRQRVQRLVALLLPRAVELVAARETTIDVRDNLLLLLHAMLHTEKGFAMANEPAQRDELVQAVEQREKEIESGAEDAEDTEREREKLRELLAALNTLAVQFPRNPSLSAASQGESENESSAPPLLIGAPPAQ